MSLWQKRLIFWALLLSSILRLNAVTVIRFARLLKLRSPPVRLSFQGHSTPLLIGRWLPFPQLSVDTEEIFSSFYSSQGRQTSFPDHNADLIDRLRASTENLATLEVS